ncbi:YdcF family protein [Patescibacteria group bacterium]|nr:YdcF family protein [Patescibacteria group bacterium]MBU4082648.1 YdcF family protein [Patescibacteria group bacterium]MCG2808721.1 YdcF family protein [Candidatus Portnoybacteria bacterium]
MKKIKPFIDTITEFLIESVPTKDLPQSDAIFVFGHYEPLVARHAADLWKKGRAPRIIITGKGRDAIPEGFETEADFYASLIESRGVPKKALILEKESTNSLENVLLGISACRNAGINPKSVILCAMPPLLKRSRATFQKQFPEIAVYGSAFPMPQEWFTPRRVNRILGELERLDEYAKKGDIVKVKIPNKVLSAAKKIRQHLLQ